VFVDAVVGNLLVFAFGQAFAWLYLRTGRFWVGTAATTLLWVAIDWWLVGRYLLDAAPSQQALPVLLLQATAAVTSIAYLWAVVRRRRAATARAERFGAGVRQLLTGAYEPAQATFEQLCWSDPWDVSAWLARGDVLRRRGDARRAGRCYARARAVDVRKRFDDLLRHREGLLRAASAPKAGPRPAATGAARSGAAVAQRATASAE